MRNWRAQRTDPLNQLISAMWQRQSQLDWLSDAACNGQPTRWWFAGDGRNLESKTAKRALAICDSCTVRAECLDWALQIPQPWHGIFAGMSPQQRIQEKQRRDNESRNVTGPEGHSDGHNGRLAGSVD
jgi:WhiB family transcriptional regulator, redox-sensing transcriptional regulator